VVGAAVLTLATGVRSLEAQAPRVTVRMRPFTTPIVLDTLARSHEYAAEPALAFAAVLAAFDAFDIPVTTRDSAQGLIANLRLVGSKSLGKLRMSQIVNCGAGLMGPNADQGRVTLVVGAFVDALAGGRSRVGFALTGSSIDLSGASIDPDACESTGYLEARLAELVQVRVTLDTLRN
jgi:hypothetical protein